MTDLAARGEGEQSVGVDDFVTSKFRDYERLERAAVRLSDALTGGGVFAYAGQEPASILARRWAMDQELITSITEVNLALRKISKSRHPTGDER